MIFRPWWGAQTYSLPHWLPISFKTLSGNTSFVSWLLFPPLLFPPAFSDERKIQWDILNFMAPADFRYSMFTPAWGGGNVSTEETVPSEPVSCHRVPRRGSSTWCRWSSTAETTNWRGCFCSQRDNSCSWERSQEKMGTHMTTGQKQLGKAEEKRNKKGHVVNIWRGF